MKLNASHMFTPSIALCPDHLRQLLNETRKNSNNLVLLCVGTDRIIGDSLGPLVGSMLHQAGFPLVQPSIPLTEQSPVSSSPSHVLHKSVSSAHPQVLHKSASAAHPQVLHKSASASYPHVLHKSASAVHPQVLHKSASASTEYVPESASYLHTPHKLLHPPAHYHLNIFGTLEHTVHALNLEKTALFIQNNYADSIILAVDASLGSSEDIGSVYIRAGNLQPGAGVHKNLPHLGDITITGIAGEQSRHPYLTLQTVRLSTIMQMAETICRCILDVCAPHPH